MFAFSIHLWTRSCIAGSGIFAAWPFCCKRSAGLSASRGILGWWSAEERVAEARGVGEGKEITARRGSGGRAWPRRRVVADEGGQPGLDEGAAGRHLRGHADRRLELGQGAKRGGCDAAAAGRGGGGPRARQGGHQVRDAVRDVLRENPEVLAQDLSGREGRRGTESERQSGRGREEGKKARGEGVALRSARLVHQELVRLRLDERDVAPEGLHEFLWGGRGEERG